MAHTYVILRQEFTEPGISGTNATANSIVRVTGTVDGTQVVVITSFAVVNQPTAIAYQNVMSPLLLAAWTTTQPAPTQPPPALTWTQ